MSEGGRLERATAPRPLRVLAGAACTCRPGYCRRAGMPRCGACAGLAAWEQCRAVADMTAGPDGNDITGRPDLNTSPRRQRAYQCPDCHQVSSPGPGHTAACWRRYITTVVRASEAVTAAREYLAGMDAAYADVGVPRPLAGHLRAVLAEIDAAAGVQ